MESVDIFVLNANIERYRRLLGTETDEVRRKTLMDLLAQAERALAQTNDPSGGSGVESEPSDTRPYGSMPPTGR